jgi:hypothetical protein
MKKKLLIFSIFSIPATVLTIRSYLWILGIIDHIDGDRMGAGIGFSLIVYCLAAAVAINWE